MLVHYFIIICILYQEILWKMILLYIKNQQNRIRENWEKYNQWIFRMNSSNECLAYWFHQSDESTFSTKAYLYLTWQFTKECVTLALLSCYFSLRLFYAKTCVMTWKNFHWYFIIIFYIVLYFPNSRIDEK